MINYKEQKTESINYVPINTTCDKCQRVIEVYEGFHKIRHEFGYGTTKDGDYLEVDWCEDCLIEIVKESKARWYEQDEQDEQDEQEDLDE